VARSQVNAVNALVLSLIGLVLVFILYYYGQEIIFSLETQEAPRPLLLEITNVGQRGGQLVLFVFNPSEENADLSGARLFFYTPDGDLVAVSSFDAVILPGELKEVNVAIPQEVLNNPGLYQVKLAAGTFSWHQFIDIYPAVSLSFKILSLRSALSLPPFYKDHGIAFLRAENDAISLPEENTIYIDIEINNPYPQSVTVTVTVSGDCVQTLGYPLTVGPGVSTYTLQGFTSAVGSCLVTVSLSDPAASTTVTDTHPVDVWYLFVCDDNAECASDIASASLKEQCRAPRGRHLLHHKPLLRRHRRKGNFRGQRSRRLRFRTEGHFTYGCQ